MKNKLRFFPKNFSMALVVFIGVISASPTYAKGFDEIAQPVHCSKTLNLLSPAPMQDKVQNYVRLSEEALSMRASAIKVYHELSNIDRGSRPLSGQELQRINEGAALLIAQREVLLAIALAHECWIVPPLEGEAGDIQRVGVLMSLSAALTLYDNYLLAVSLFRDDSKLRRHLNKADQGYALGTGELRKAELIYSDPVIRLRVRRAIKWFDRYGKGASGFEGYDYLYQSIVQSPSKNLVSQKNPFHVMRAVFEIFGGFSIDSLVHTKDQTGHFASLLVGNAMGLVETRKGKLFGQSTIERTLTDTLQAGDILLEKTPFRLTDQFIPGHWGHAALWLGTEQELMELGLWDHELVRPHREAIQAGRGVVEALRSGVEMNSLAHFLNVDDLAVLRRVGISDETRRQVILHALRQVGKGYDFNFDAESTDLMYCSKLVYYVYGDIQWPTSRMLGRHTVSPDDIARRSLDDGPLAIVLLYHDGSQITPEPLAMKQLLDSSRSEQNSGLSFWNE